MGTVIFDTLIEANKHKDWMDGTNVSEIAIREAVFCPWLLIEMGCCKRGPCGIFWKSVVRPVKIDGKTKYEVEEGECSILRIARGTII